MRHLYSFSVFWNGFARTDGSMFPWAWQLELFMRIVHVVIIFRDCPLEGIVPTGRFSLLDRKSVV